MNARGADARLHCVVLDDYQHVALRCADWQSLASQVRVTCLHEHLDDADALVAALQEADIVVLTRERTPLLAPTLRRLPRLRLVVTMGMRNGVLDVAAARAQGITVCGTDTLLAPPVELTWGLILAWARHVPTEHDNFRRAGPWQLTVGRDLAGRTLGIVGLGRLGQRVAAVAVAFGMHVLAWSQNLDDARCQAAGVTRAPTLDDLLARSDIVTVHQVLSARTRGLIGAAQLARMTPDALLVNTSRPGIVDEAALADALSAGRLGGAALDVFSQEPLPASHPLRRCPRLIATPHLGYVTDDSYRLMFGMVVEDIAAWLAGSPLREIVEDHPARALEGAHAGATANA